MLEDLEKARLVGRNHVLDGDVSFLSAVALQDLQSLPDELGQVHVLLLAVVHLVAEVFWVRLAYSLSL